MKFPRVKPTRITIWLLFVLCIIFGFSGFSTYYTSIGEDVDFYTKVYNTIQLFVFESPVINGKVPVLLNIARFMAPILLASTILEFLFDSIQNRVNLLVIRNKFNDHIIFIGFNNISRLLVRDYIRERKQKVLIINNDQNNFFDYPIKNNQVRFLEGNAEDIYLLRKANIGKASTVFIIEETDLTNLSIANKIASYCEKNKIDRELRVILHISDHFNMKIFKEFQEKKNRNIDFHAFDINQKFAAVAASRFCPDQYREFDESSKDPCHVLIHGLNNVTEHLICEAANLYHFADLKKIKITVVTEQVEEKIEPFLLNYPSITKAVDLRLVEAFKVSESVLQNSLADVILCFVCCETEGKSYYTAQRYRQEFTASRLRHASETEKESAASVLELPRIVVLSPGNMDLFNLFENFNDTANYIRIERFALNIDICNKLFIADDEEATDNLAMQMHNIYRDLTQPELIKSWDALTEREKDFNRYPVRHLAIKLRYLKLKIVPVNAPGLSIDLDNHLSATERDVLSRMEHDRWLAEKLVYGYQTVDDLNNPDFQSNLKNRLLLHKDIRPWEELSASDKDKDSMIIDNIKTIIRATGNKLIKY